MFPVHENLGRVDERHFDLKSAKRIELAVIANSCEFGKEIIILHTILLPSIPKFLRHISEPSHNNSRIGLVMSILQTCGFIFLRIIRKGGSGNERIFGFLAVDAHRALAMLRLVDVDSQVALAIGKDERVLVALLILLLVLPVTAVVDGEIIIESYLPIAGRIVSPKRGEELFDTGIDALDAKYLVGFLPFPAQQVQRQRAAISAQRILFITFIFWILRCKFKERNPIKSTILFTFCLFIIILHYKQQSKQKVNFHNYVA